MQKTKIFYNTKFSVDTIEAAHNKFITLNGIKKNYKISDLTIDFSDESWSYDTRGEYLSSYPKAKTFRFDHIYGKERFIMYSHSSNSTAVRVDSQERAKIEYIFNIFEKNVSKSQIVLNDPIKIFIGHGRNDQWRLLKDHLHDMHDYEVIAYEIGPRAGLSIKEVLEKMLTNSSIAFLVMTGEDVHNDGKYHARENVIHEIGLFQGHLGFERAIVLKEERVKEFSNILGINQIRFSMNNIRETFGEVLATIKREFSN